MTDTKPILSDDARKRFREVLDDVEHRGALYEIRRYQTPSAIVVPVEWFEQARTALVMLADDATVVMTTANANEADRLRRLARENGSLGIPFPNNGHPTWRVMDARTGEPVAVHSVSSVGVTVEGA